VNWFISALIIGVIAFSATNLDDILFLTIFFSQTPRKWQVVVGQYLGFTALMLVSLIGFFGGRIFVLFATFAAASAFARTAATPDVLQGSGRGEEPSGEGTPADSHPELGGVLKKSYVFVKHKRRLQEPPI